MLKRLVLNLIRFYQKWLSFDQSILFGGLGIKVCRFTPSCSEYTFQAVEKYGIFKGGFRGLTRILRCHPFAKGGHDPLS